MVTANVDIGAGVVLRALRGATTAASDEPEAVAAAVRELVGPRDRFY